MFTQNLNPTQKTLIPLLERNSVSIRETAKVNIEATIREVCQKVAPIWPLANFIAVNPLQGYESETFKDAVEVARRMYHAKGIPTLNYFQEQFKRGRITQEDLLEVLKASNSPVSVESLTNVLVQDANTEAFLLLSEWADQLLGTKLYPLMQGEVSKWAGAYFDRGEAAWSMPGREKGFFQAWRNLIRYEKGVELAGLTGFREYVEKLPSDSVKAIEKMIKELGIPDSQIANYLTRHLASAPGWAGLFMLQGSENNFYQGRTKLEPVIDYLAVRLTYDAVGSYRVFSNLQGFSSPWVGMLDLANEKLPNEDETTEKTPTARMIWLEAFERNYRKELLGKLAKASLSRQMLESSKQKRPKAQAVFCIDVRSEAFRRNLEQEGHFDTYGFAGFFAVPLAHQDFGAEEPSPQCPVLIRPKYLVYEEPVTGSEAEGARALNHKESVRALHSALHEVKNTSTSPFALVETFGGLGFLMMAFRSFAPKLKKALGQGFSRWLGISVKTRPQLKNHKNVQHSHYQLGIPVEDQVLIAENSLKIMGLLNNFGRLVLLCGHGSTTTNNAYASALDCGACGGHRGAPNARVAVKIFNDQKVRNALEAKGISIPSDTVFIAGEHNTATDAVTILDEEFIPSTHLGDLGQLKSALTRAGQSLNLERTQRFDNPKTRKEEAVEEVKRRSLDWSEARPEWGLAGNAAFIVAKRDLTRTLDLKSRSFLHSYDWASDSTGRALEVIMTAPMVVAEWINTQYYFSSVDNEVFGSGTKVIHNVVGKLGVMQGNVSDLKIGLPLQSVSNGKELVHEPMRLLVVIEAPKERVAAIVRNHESVKKLVVNEWIRLVVLDPMEQTFYRLSPNLSWEKEYPVGMTLKSPESQLVH